MSELELSDAEESWPEEAPPELPVPDVWDVLCPLVPPVGPVLELSSSEVEPLVVPCEVPVACEVEAAEVLVLVADECEVLEVTALEVVALEVAEVCPEL